jgi:hypothetical protein
VNQSNIFCAFWVLDKTCIINLKIIVSQLYPRGLGSPKRAQSIKKPPPPSSMYSSLFMPLSSSSWGTKSGSSPSTSYPSTRSLILRLIKSRFHILNAANDRLSSSSWASSSRNPSTTASTASPYSAATIIPFKTAVPCRPRNSKPVTAGE